MIIIIVLIMINITVLNIIIILVIVMISGLVIIPQNEGIVIHLFLSFSSQQAMKEIEQQKIEVRFLGMVIRVTSLVKRACVH